MYTRQMPGRVGVNLSKERTIPVAWHRQRMQLDKHMVHSTGQEELPVVLVQLLKVYSTQTAVVWQSNCMAISRLSRCT